MHAISLRTIWLVMLTSLALIASSMASSKTLMPIQMLTMSADSISHCSPSMMANMNLDDLHHQISNDSSDPITIDCDTDSSMQHDCCGTTCINVFATLSSEPLPLTPIFSTFSYPLEPTRSTVKGVDSLYRPPSA